MFYFFAEALVFKGEIEKKKRKEQWMIHACNYVDGWWREKKLNIWPDELWMDEDKQQQMGKGKN